ncbi:MAG: hypothetical protein ABI835_14085 [Chloroflexota bacterium]
MRKRFGFAIFVSLLVFAFAAQAQDDPTPTEQSVSDAVATLLAQTQQAPAQINLTQTVQVALEQALTATAQAATPAPVDAATLEVVSTTEIDLVAGPARTSVYLAPDGERFVYRAGNSLCLYAQDTTEPQCTELPAPMSALDPDSVRWSPDSRTITFTENFFVMLVDADVWVWDTTADEVSDLTDDGSNHISFGSSDDWHDIDIAPTWLPDGRIVFLRYSRVNDVIAPPEILVIAPDGSGLEKLGEIEMSAGFAVYALDATEDHLFYNYFLPHDVPENGIWTSNLDGSNPEQIAQTEQQSTPSSVSESPDGRYALITTQYPGFGDYRPEVSIAQVLDLESGEILLIDPERYVVSGGWSPDGSAFVYLVNDPSKVEESGLYITHTAGEAGRLLVAGRFLQGTAFQRQPLMWGANNTILLARAPGSGIVIVKLGS